MLLIGAGFSGGLLGGDRTKINGPAPIFDGSLPLIGVNTFLPKERGGDITTTIELIRSTEEEKGQQIANVEAYRANRNALAPESLKRLQQAARDRENVFAQLMEAVKYNSEGQISHALYDVGGEYRRNM